MQNLKTDNNVWQKGKIKDVANVVSGYGFPIAFQGKTKGEYPFIKVRDISETVQKGSTRITSANHYIDTKELNVLKAKPFTAGTVVFAKIGEAIKLNRRAILSQATVADNNVMGIEPNKDKLIPEFLLYFLNTIELEEISHSTTVPSIRKSDVENIDIIYPDVATQQEIAKSLEELTGKITLSVNGVKKAKKLVQKFRQAILSAAVTGKLTEDWRNNNSLPDWEPTTVEQISRDISYGYTASANRETVGPKLLRITDIQDGKVNWESVPYCSIEASKIDKYKLGKGDIVFARTGATTGKSFLITACPLSVFASYLIRVQPNVDKVSPEYLYLFFQSNEYWRQIASQVSGSAQPNCNATKLASLEMELPTKEEQVEVVAKVNSYFEVADKVEKQIEKAETRVSKLTQAILAKTFNQE